jgi:histidinol phosphatase-like PHP family hydrolase
VKSIIFRGLNRSSTNSRQIRVRLFYWVSALSADIAISDSKEGPEYFANHSLQEMTDEYFDLLYNVAACGLFEVIGHADYYWRFAFRYFGEEVYQIYRGRLAPIAEAAAENGLVSR